jgi:hypothetical protein
MSNLEQINAVGLHALHALGDCSLDNSASGVHWPKNTPFSGTYDILYRG